MARNGTHDIPTSVEVKICVINANTIGIDWGFHFSATRRQRVTAPHSIWQYFMVWCCLPFTRGANKECSHSRAGGRQIFLAWMSTSWAPAGTVIFKKPPVASRMIVSGIALVIVPIQTKYIREMVKTCWEPPAYMFNITQKASILHACWHSILHIFWHSIWHLFWNSISLIL